MTYPVAYFDDIDPEKIPSTAGELLDSLDRPSVFLRRGRDSSRTRVVAAMLHGNEPSGLVAVHRVLREATPPEVDLSLFVGGVEAAKAPPRHGHRMLDGRRDLNRCFAPPFDDPDGRIARTALDILLAREPEAALDLHNNTGHNPAYSITLRLDGARLGLARLFTDLHIHTDLQLGTFMEALDAVCPMATIECGQAKTTAADEVACRGLDAFARARELPIVDLARERVEVLEHPIRVTLAPGQRVAFGPGHRDATLVLDADTDRHNFQRLAAGTHLATVRGTSPVVSAFDASGLDRTEELFEQRAGALFTRCRLTPIMMTTDPKVATSDCLFYVVPEPSERAS